MEGEERGGVEKNGRRGGVRKKRGGWCEAGKVSNGVVWGAREGGGGESSEVKEYYSDEQN